MKFTVVGLGYVGLSLATLLSSKHEVKAVDVIEEKVSMINNRISPIKDEYIEKFFNEKELNLEATLNMEKAVGDADYVIIATPTDYNEETDYFDTKSIEDTINNVLKYNPEASIVIKSTIPIGYTDELKENFNIENIFFSPEFLREGKALYDNLYPSRIIVGSYDENSLRFAKVLQDLSQSETQPEILQMENKEAEAVKLFSNTYLAMRVSYFNEVDIFAERNDLNSEKVIKGVSLDPRIGDFYNNPSFGYGGYCLPKDTKQTLANFEKMNIPNALIGAIVESNNVRKDHIVDTILNMNVKIVGVYSLAMKTGSDNYRSSAIFDIISKLQDKGIEIIVYEKYPTSEIEQRYNLISDIKSFIETSELIIANRLTVDLVEVAHKVYTRDIFNVN